MHLYSPEDEIFLTVYSLLQRIGFVLFYLKLMLC